MAGIALADDPVRVQALARMRAAGQGVRTIADQLGCSHPTVVRSLQRQDVKQLIADIHAEMMIDAPQNAARNLRKLIADYPTLSEGQTKEHAFKASVKMLESIGVLPSHAPSQVTVNILNAENVNVSPVVVNVLRQIGASLSGDVHNGDSDSGVDADRETIDVDPDVTD